ncbi:MAG: NAD-dependent epimerase/dehydratase family protein [Bacteroidetes bacterium]|nr:NAD-dependent epimerase/dehydratase family protein [Bacteroidota bacterium]
MKILITGTAGFIGYHLTKRLLEGGQFDVVGLDNVNAYYDTELKRARLKALGVDASMAKPNKMCQSTTFDSLRFVRMNLEDEKAIESLFLQEKFDYVIHLAAQAGVRYSLEAPRSYIKSNVLGFLNILEGCRLTDVKHLIYASSSSIYGQNTNVPFSETDRVDHPVSLYAASKRSDELMAYSYSHLFGIPCTGLRFFTVYGSFGRPDMAYFIFTKKILNEEPIQVFNHGKMKRDFTFVDDITQAVEKLIPNAPKGSGFDPEKQQSTPPFSVYNIGNNNPVEIMQFIHTLEELLNKKAILEMKPMQPGDVEMTYADTTALYKHIGYQPNTLLKDGLKEFVDWFKHYYQTDKRTT